MNQTDNETLVSALRTLARGIASGDGVANAAIAEAADRIEMLSDEQREIAGIVEEYRTAIDEIRDTVLNERYQLAESGLDADQVNAVLDVIDENHPEPFQGEGSDE